MKFLISIVLLFFNISYGMLLIKPEDAIKEQFPDSKIVKKNILLTKKQVSQIQKLSKSRLNSSIITVYFIKKDGKNVGYGIINTHKVRTKKETVLFILSPDCKIQDIEIIAFYEPPEYMPDKRWLKVFKGKDSSNQLRLKRDIPNITGATLSSKAITTATRQTVYICETVLKGKK